MKFRLLFVLMLATVMVMSLWGSYKTNVVDLVGLNSDTVFIYCKSYNGLNVASGAGHVVTNSVLFDRCMQNATGVQAVTVVLDKSCIDVVALVKKLKLKQPIWHQTTDFCSVYGYCDRLDGYVLVDGQRVNVQIAVTPTQVHVGSPLILGSY
ncbi:MAG: YwmB family TATA-box binding protein [Clostridia bacterium]|nr:YwmB family TATA-box binding protein [Clostridia bacterium]